MLFGQSEGQVFRRLQIPLHHYARIHWNPVSFRFIRSTLRTSLRSICLLRARRSVLDGTDPPLVSRNVRQHVLDFLDNDALNERFLYRRHSSRILGPCSRIRSPNNLSLSTILSKHFQFFTFSLAGP